LETGALETGASVGGATAGASPPSHLHASTKVGRNEH